MCLPSGRIRHYSLSGDPEDRPTAQQAAGWLASGTWRGRPEPLPAATPAAWRQPVPPVGETVPATTYMLPSASTPAVSRSRRSARQRPDVRGLAARRPGLVGAIAGVVLFLAAVFPGMVWFAPDSGTPETSRTNPGRTTSSDPASAPLVPSTGPGAAPTHGSAPTPSSSVLSDEERQEAEATESVGPSKEEGIESSKEEKGPGKESKRERRGEEDEDD